MGNFGTAVGASMASNPVGWIMGGIAVANYISARKKQRAMQDRLKPIAASQMKSIVDERGEIVSEYQGMANRAKDAGNLAMESLYTNRNAKMRQSSNSVGKSNMSFSSSNVMADNLLNSYNMAAEQQGLKTGGNITNIQNQLASEIRGSDASGYDLQSLYAKQGVKVDFNPSDVESLKYV
jgi:hypothetical protein